MRIAILRPSATFLSFRNLSRTLPNQRLGVVWAGKFCTQDPRHKQTHNACRGFVYYIIYVLSVLEQVFVNQVFVILLAATCYTWFSSGGGMVAQVLEGQLTTFECCTMATVKAGISLGP